jgi:hypothetical protein
MRAFENPGGLVTGEEAWGQTPWSSKHKGQAPWSKHPGKGLGVKAPGVKSPIGSRHGGLIVEHGAYIHNNVMTMG